MFYIDMPPPVYYYQPQIVVEQPIYYEPQPIYIQPFPTVEYKRVIQTPSGTIILDKSWERFYFDNGISQ